MADEGLLGGQAEPARGGAAGDDEGARVDGFVAEVEGEGVLREVGGGEVAEAEIRAEAGRLLAHVLDELGALDAFGPAGKIFDESGDGKLAARLVALEDERFEIGSGAVDRSCEPGAAGAEDDCIAYVLCHFG